MKGAENALETADAVQARWPRRLPLGRLGPVCRPVHEGKFSIPADATIFAIGSCFARNIEDYLLRAGLRVLSTDLTFPDAELGRSSRHNDLLVKYSPGSMLQEISGALTGDQDERHLIAEGDRWRDLSLPSFLPSVSYERALERRGQVRQCFAKVALSDVVVITLGLIEEWHDTRTGLVLNGTPSPRLVKQWPGRFGATRLDYNHALSAVQKIIDLLKSANGTQDIILTVSPVPLGRTFTDQDVIIANQSSKAILRAIAGDIGARNGRLDYFPAYEIVTLSNPDLAFAEDLRHVNDSMVAEVAAQFFQSYGLTGNSDLTESYGHARRELEAGHYETAYLELSALLGRLGDERFLRAYCTAAVETDHHEECLAAVEDANLRFGPRANFQWTQLHALLGLGRYEEAAAVVALLQQNATERPLATAYELLIAQKRRDREAAGIAASKLAILSDEEAASLPAWARQRLAGFTRRAGDTPLVE